MSRTVVTLDGPEAVARAAADRVVALAGAARERFALALSGGSTPRLLHRLLAEEPRRSRIEWAAVEIFWGDERAVPPTHPDSNFGMARHTLLDHVPIPAGRIHRMEAEREDRAAAAAAYEAELARVLGGVAGGPPPALDLVILGMGPDGHTASLFPGTAALAERRAWVAANHVATLGADRLTLTYPVLNAAAQVLFLVTGSDKAEALRAVLEGRPDSAGFPAQGVRPVPGELTWLVDRAAAARLTTSGPTR